MKKVISVIVCSILILFGATPAYANYEELNPRFAYFTQANAYARNSNRTIEAECEITTFQTCTIKVRLIIEKSTNGNDNSWSTYKSFPLEEISSGRTRCFTDSVDNVPSNYYRTKAYIYVYVGGSLKESHTIYSTPIYVNWY